MRKTKRHLHMLARMCTRRGVGKVECLLVNLEPLSVGSGTLHVKALATERSSMALRWVLSTQAWSMCLRSTIGRP